jgi:hypothetical protein
MITNLAWKNQNQDKKKQKNNQRFSNSPPQPAAARHATVQSTADKIRTGFLNPLSLHEFNKSTPRTRNPASDLSH